MPTFNDSNTVELVGVYGSDETHALSAWTSTRREIDDERRARMGDLLRFLAENRHETPFEKSTLHFVVTTDIATHIHLLKHRIGVSVNAESARYKELRADRAYEPRDIPPAMRSRYEEHISNAFELYHDLVVAYTSMGVSEGLDERAARKRAKEAARFVLPYANQITSDVTFNFRSFNHFLRLRYSTHAQVEVSELARRMLELVHETGRFPLTLRAFGYVDDSGELRGPFDD